MLQAQGNRFRPKTTIEMEPHSCCQCYTWNEIQLRLAGFNQCQKGKAYNCSVTLAPDFDPRISQSVFGTPL